jgi:hypothetical protein
VLLLLPECYCLRNKIAMPKTFAYCINFFSALLPDVFQGLARYFPERQGSLTFFSFAFNGHNNYTPAADTATGALLFFKRIA